MSPQEPRDLRSIEPRNEDTDRLVRQLILVQLDVLQKIISVGAIAAVGHTLDCRSGTPARSVAFCVSETEVVVCRDSF
jgi:hypothetical protein